jgi:hybrid cluster-associated redox disulfide protein
MVAKKTAVKKSVAKAAKPKASKASADAVTENSIIGETVNKYPFTVPIFFKHGLMCLGCGFAMMETIGQGCMGHGIAVGPLVKDLNEAVKKGAKK